MLHGPRIGDPCALIMLEGKRFLSHISVVADDRKRLSVCYKVNEKWTARACCE